MFYADYHIHTSFSSDSTSPMKDMIQAAISLGLKEIAITDHVDFDYPDTKYPFLIEFNDYKKTIVDFQNTFKDKIKIKVGVEIGLQPNTNHKNIVLTKENDYDFVIGSTHCVDGLELYGGSYYEGKSKEEAFLGYFRDVLNSIKTCDCFDVFGHVDYINRYSNYENNTVGYLEYKDIIDDILKELILRGKGLDINTSGYKYGLGYAHPQLSILKAYKKFGGEIITIGSDAHSPEYIASHFNEAYNLINEAGFKAITIFDKRKPTFIDL